MYDIVVVVVVVLVVVLVVVVLVVVVLIKSNFSFKPTIYLTYNKRKYHSSLSLPTLRYPPLPYLH